MPRRATLNSIERPSGAIVRGERSMIFSLSIRQRSSHDNDSLRQISLFVSLLNPLNGGRDSFAPGDLS
jgi:hypothetical protein